MADIIEKERAVRAFQGGVPRRLLRHAQAWLAVLAIAAAGYCAYAITGMKAQATAAGAVTGLSVRYAVAVYRDERGIPHIRARTAHDAFFAEGYAQGADRLFQMDLLRRYIYGELAEMLGPIQLPLDERMRALDVRGVVAREWAHLGSEDRRALQAFSDGVDAAMRTQPLPVEFRLLLYRPEPWTPRDSLAVTLAISSSISDTPENVLARDALWHSMTPSQYSAVLPLSDPRYDVSAAGRLRRREPSANIAWRGGARRVAITGAGSNAWAAGGARTVRGRALLANDPHLTLGIPGIWYAVEMRAPGFHVAGVTIPGIPGVILGHNDRIAWGTTTAMASTLSVFRAGRLDPARWRREVFHVRFSHDTVLWYYRTPRDFSIPGETENGTLLIRWAPYSEQRSALTTVLALDRAHGIAEATTALAAYEGPPQNFVVVSGDEAAYHLAGIIPDDPAWGRYVHRSGDLNKLFAPVPFRALPAIVPSRGALVVSANNKMYRTGYAYRLSPMFAPPYRAYRIATLLHARRLYNAAYFARMQLDENSPADAEFAHRLAAYARTHGGILPPQAVYELASWNGDFSPASRGATLEHSLREDAERASVSPYAALDALRARQPPASFLDALREPQLDVRRLRPWALAGEVNVLHPFGAIGFPFLNGPVFAGAGDAYTIRVQTPEISQSFRAVWVAGDWDAGGLSLPTGESGEIGSPHYDDLSSAWRRGELPPLPFSDAAVMRAARERLLLEK